MRFLPIHVVGILAAAAAAQCPYYANGPVSAGLSRVGGGEDVRLVYVDCLASIGVIEAKFGNTSGLTNLNGLPLTLAIYDDPNDDSDPHDAVLVAQVAIPGGITGGNTGQWQRYDLQALLGNPVPATGGMWVGLGVPYAAGTNPGPSSIEFFNNVAPGTQWMATDSGGTGINYAGIGMHQLVDLQTGPGFPAGSWVIRVESGAAYRPFGAGCPGSNGTPALVGGAVLPVLGQAMVLDATHLPLAGGASFLLLGFAMQSPAIDLGTALGTGANGCLAIVQPIGTNLLTLLNGTSQFALGLPATPSLAGVSVLGQVLSFDPTANAAGVTASNGLRSVLGY
jgi:hypothetical protein